MKTVLLVNRNKCSNIGDQAINKVFLNYLDKNFLVNVCSADYTSTLLSAPSLRAPKKTVQKYIKSILKVLLPLNLIWLARNYSRLVKEYKKCEPDLVILGGGQLLLPGRFTYAAFLWVSLAKKYKSKVVFSNIGIGGNFSLIEKHILKYTLSQVDGINFRDIDSVKAFEKFNATLDNVHISADIVFSAAKKVEKNHRATDRVLVGVPELAVYNEYNTKITRKEYYDLWLSFIINNHVSLDLVSLFYTTTEDFYEAQAFQVYVFDVYGIILPIEEYNDLNSFIDLLSEQPLIVSGRMHALIIALNNGCKIKVFPISPKLTTFDIQVNEESISDLSKATKYTTFDFLSNFIDPKEVPDIDV